MFALVIRFSMASNLVFVCLRQTERLQALLADNEKVSLCEIDPIPLPLEPQVHIRGIVPDTATLFKVHHCHTRHPAIILWCDYEKN